MAKRLLFGALLVIDAVLWGSMMRSANGTSLSSVLFHGMIEKNWRVGATVQLEGSYDGCSILDTKWQQRGEAKVGSDGRWTVEIKLQLPCKIQWKWKSTDSPNSNNGYEYAGNNRVADLDPLSDTIDIYSTFGQVGEQQKVFYSKEVRFTLENPPDPDPSKVYYHCGMCKPAGKPGIGSMNGWNCTAPLNVNGGQVLAKTQLYFPDCGYEWKWRRGLQDYEKLSTGLNRHLDLKDAVLSTNCLGSQMLTITTKWEKETVQDNFGCEVTPPTTTTSTSTTGYELPTTTTPTLTTITSTTAATLELETTHEQTVTTTSGTTATRTSVSSQPTTTIVTTPTATTESTTPVHQTSTLPPATTAGQSNTTTQSQTEFTTGQLTQSSVDPLVNVTGTSLKLETTTVVRPTDAQSMEPLKTTTSRVSTTTAHLSAATDPSETVNSEPTTRSDQAPTVSTSSPPTTDQLSSYTENQPTTTTTVSVLETTTVSQPYITTALMTNQNQYNATLHVGTTTDTSTTEVIDTSTLVNDVSLSTATAIVAQSTASIDNPTTTIEAVSDAGTGIPSATSSQLNTTMSFTTVTTTTTTTTTTTMTANMTTTEVDLPTTEIVSESDSETTSPILSMTTSSQSSITANFTATTQNQAVSNKTDYFETRTSDQPTPTTTERYKRSTEESTTKESKASTTAGQLTTTVNQQESSTVSPFTTNSTELITMMTKQPVQNTSVSPGTTAGSDDLNKSTTTHFTTSHHNSTDVATTLVSDVPSLQSTDAEGSSSAQQTHGPVTKGKDEGFTAKETTSVQSTTISAIEANSNTDKNSGSESMTDSAQQGLKNPLYLGLVIGGSCFLATLAVIISALCYYKFKRAKRRRRTESLEEVSELNLLKQQRDPAITSTSPSAAWHELDSTSDFRRSIIDNDDINKNRLDCNTTFQSQN